MNEDFYAEMWFDAHEDFYDEAEAEAYGYFAEDHGIDSVWEE